MSPGNVDVGTDMAVQFDHEGLAEAHDLGFGSARRIEIRAAFSAAHRQAGEGILECLFEAQEFQDRGVHGGFEAQAALVGSDGGVELHPVAAIDMRHVVIIAPFDTKGDRAIRLHQAL